MTKVTHKVTDRVLEACWERGQGGWGGEGTAEQIYFVRLCCGLRDQIGCCRKPVWIWSSWKQQTTMFSFLQMDLTATIGDAVVTPSYRAGVSRTASDYLSVYAVELCVTVLALQWKENVSANKQPSVATHGQRSQAVNEVSQEPSGLNAWHTAQQLKSD